MNRYGIRVIGLTGGIAAGKSTVAKYFQEQGAAVIDADQLARDAVSPGSPALRTIVDIYGSEMLLPDGNLDRKRLGRTIFADPEKRRQLERIVHPEIRRLAEEKIAVEAAKGQSVVFYMAPLLIETGATDRVDEVWVVTVRPEVQRQRLMARDGISQDQVDCMIASQMPLAEKESYGRIVIDNSGSLEETRQILAQVWAKEIGSLND